MVTLRAMAAVEYVCAGGGGPIQEDLGRMGDFEVGRAEGMNPLRECR